MKKLASILLVAGLATATSSAFAAAQATTPTAIANYLGTGKDPTLIMDFTTSSAQGRSIWYGYSYIFNPPADNTSEIYDQAGNDYGTLKIVSGPDWLGFGSYQGKSNFLCGINVAYDKTVDGVKYFNVTTNKICNTPGCTCN